MHSRWNGIEFLLINAFQCFFNSQVRHKDSIGIPTTSEHNTQIAELLNTQDELLMTWQTDSGLSTPFRGFIREKTSDTILFAGQQIPIAAVYMVQRLNISGPHPFWETLVENGMVLSRVVPADGANIHYLSPVDEAQTAPGGIDLNSANLNLRIKRDGNGIPLPLAQQDLAQLGNIEGLSPVILSIQPASQTAVFAHLLANP